MRIIEQKCYQCAECGFYLTPASIPGRVPKEPALATLTHPSGTCSFADKQISQPVQIIDTDRLDVGSYRL